MDSFIPCKGFFNIFREGVTISKTSLFEINASKEGSISSANSDELDENISTKENKVKPTDKENIHFDESSTLTDKNKEINDEVRKEVISIDDSDDDCGYHSSDFEFITEEEAKGNGFIINIKPNKPKEKVNKRKRSKKVKTIEIVIDPFSEQRDTKNPNRNSHNPGPNKLQRGLKWNNFSSEQRENPTWNNLDPGPSNKPITWPGIDSSHSGLNKVSSNGFGSSLRNVRKTFHKKNIGPCPGNLNITGAHSETVDQSAHTQINNPEPGNTDKDGSTPKIVQDRNDAGPTILINCTERSNPLQINYLETNMQENGFDSNISKRDDPETSEIERWRTFQYRNQLNIQQFVPDQSYRQNHRIFMGQEYYNLFHPNFGPLPNRSSIRFLENKSTMSGAMPVEYQGIGLNMNMLRQMDGNESDLVKKEADECARSIFEMYPEENRNRRRRRF